MAILKFQAGLTFTLVFFLASFWPATAETVAGEKQRFQVVTVAEGLEHPWGLAFLPDGGMLVTERPGRLRLIRQGRLDPEPVQGLPAIVDKGQGGLLDVALHPDFAKNKTIYFSYVAAGEGGIGTEVARGRLNGHRLEGVETIFRQQPKSGKGIHFGSRLVFDRAGYLYITLGDRGEMARAQRGGRPSRFGDPPAR
jgi:glucose/arabinose dehydrogenase